MRKFLFMRYILIFLSLCLVGNNANALNGCSVENIKQDIENSEFHSGCLIVDKEGYMLMSIHKNGKFSIPGGTRNKGESPYHVACREVQEEVGTVPVIHDVFKTYNKSGMTDNFILFACSIDEKVDNNHKFEDEIIGNKWVKIDQISDEKLRRPNEYRELYKEVLTRIKDKTIKLSDRILT